MSNQPPKYLLRFFRWFCHPDYVEDIEGDLLERYEKNPSGWSFLIEVMKLVRPSLIKGWSLDPKHISMGIFSNYLKTTIRSARKEMAFTILTIVCLTIGFTATIYVGLYTKHELSYDTFHVKADYIYRINQTFIWGDTDKQFGSTGPAVMNAIQAEVPEFETMTRVMTYNDAVVSIQSGNRDLAFEEGKLRGADSTFFDVFTFPMIQGNPETALVEPYSVVITKSMAEKYFGSIDALGELVTIHDENHEHSYIVTGVVADIPSNSHVTFDLLTSLSSVEGLRQNSDTWWWTAFVTFGVLREDADPNLVARKVSQVPIKYLDPFLMRFQGITYQEFIESGKTWDLFMQPLTDIHLSNNTVFSRLSETRDIQTIIVLNAICGLILLLSIINFINLTTARSSRRSKEVGIRKVIGTTRSLLVGQFLFESFLFCLVSVILGFVMVKLLASDLEVIFGQQISLGHLFDPIGIAFILGGIVLITLLAGIYPAFFLSGVEPFKVIKGQLVSGNKGNFVRRLLVTVQFSISIGLIACSLIINDQVQHWLNMDFGFARDNIIVIQNLERLDTSVNSFRSDLAQNPKIKSVAFSSDTPPYIGHSESDFQLRGAENTSAEVSYFTADEHFVDVYGFQMIAGANFQNDKNNANKILVSRSLIEQFGITDPREAIGKHLDYYKTSAQIVGVFENVETEVRWTQLPIAIYYEDFKTVKMGNGNGLVSPGPFRELSVHVRDGITANEMNELVTALKSKWSNFSSLPLKYYFLDQEFRSIFEPTIRFGKMINLYSIIAAIIAGLGLMGLVAYVIERRKKEIGIRKVLGASVSSVLVLLLGEFGKLLLLGFVAATSISWFVMKNWQADFEYQNTMSPLTFVSAGLLMAAVAILTIGYQTHKAARSNPVKYLRDE